MDNLTHALAGLLIAECGWQLRARNRRPEAASAAVLRTGTAIASMVAANLPDFDLLYTGTGADPLAYMLHHRGYTHTVLIALLGALGLWGLTLALLRWRSSMPVQGSDQRWLGGVLVISTLSHLVLDWTNSYGVHPFWPIDSRWFYGDSVFIVEPWFWVIAIPTLVAASTSRAARVVLSLALVAGLALAWRVPLVSRGAAAALTLGAVLTVLLVRRLAPPSRAACSLTAWICVTVAMATGSAVARSTATRAVRAAVPDAELLDVVVTPLPANPLCSMVITVERTGDRYAVQMARVSAAASVVNPASCAATGNGGPTFTASTRASSPAVRWDRQWSASIAELGAMRRASCTLGAALRFLRVPVWAAVGGRDDVRLGDARFGGAAGGNLSVRASRASSPCTVPVPPWTPPRTDLVGGGR